MRQGSTVLGSLGSIPRGIKTLILPMCAVAVPAALLPTAALAAGQRECSRFPAWWQEASHSASVVLTAPALAPAPAVAAPAKEAPARKAPDATAAEIARVIQTRATWYGPGFHGRRTASGERFNQYAMTLASRHLPFGTVVRVVNPRNGRAAVARVNDRGPFRSGYTADLSKGLAQRIGMGGSGPIRLEILKKRK